MNTCGYVDNLNVETKISVNNLVHSLTCNLARQDFIGCPKLKTLAPHPLNYCRIIKSRNNFLKNIFKLIILLLIASLIYNMVSLAFSLLSAARLLIPRSHNCVNLQYCEHVPKLMFRTLEASFLEQFEEILVIGDVHGCYDELKILLEKSGAESDSILKLFVGDLVNKGPKSEEVLDLVRNSKSMFSVRGNHDEVVLDEYFLSENPDYHTKKKNLWMTKLTRENIEFLKELPYTISLPSLNVIIVHAGLIPGYPIELTDRYHMVHMRNIVMTDYFWEEGLMPIDNTKKGDPWAALWGGPQHIYFGHDAKRLLQQYPFATGLDTGCVYGGKLTAQFISGRRKGEFVHVDALKVHEKGKG